MDTTQVSSDLARPHEGLSSFPVIHVYELEFMNFFDIYLNYVAVQFIS